MIPAPTVSAVMPSYNRLNFLRAAVASVLAQTFTDWELIIADDGSDDETRQYLEGLRTTPRIKLLLLKHCGNPGAVRNAAVRAARGEWLAFLDSDDLWHPDKLATQLALMRDNPRWRWSYDAIDRIDSGGSVIPRPGGQPRSRPQGDILEEVIRWRAAVAMPTVVVQRALFDEAGGFDETQRMFEDFDLWMRLAATSPAGVLDTPLVSVRFHGEHYGARGEAALREWIALFERWSARLPARDCSGR